MIHPFLKNKLPEIIEIFKKYRIKSAYAFGSVCTPDFSDVSDVDLLIEFEEIADPLILGEYWWNVLEELEAIFNRKVDLITVKSLKNPYFIEEVNEKKEFLYGKAA